MGNVGWVACLKEKLVQYAVDSFSYIMSDSVVAIMCTIEQNPTNHDKCNGDWSTHNRNII